MCRQFRDPQDRGRNILSAHRMRTAIEVVAGLLVAAGAHQREFGLDHAGLNAGDAHPRPRQIAAQAKAELMDESLGAAIDIAARIRIGRRDRGDVDHRPLARDQPRQQLVRDRHQPCDIGVDHLAPLVQIRALRGRRAQREAGIVDQHIDAGKRRRQPGNRRIDLAFIAHIKRQRMHLVRAKFRHQARQPLGPPPRRHHPPARPHKGPRRSLANARSRPGDECYACHNDALALSWCRSLPDMAKPGAPHKRHRHQLFIARWF